MSDKLIKVCGLRDPENIQEVIGLGPDWIGLIFYPGSPRFISDPDTLKFLKTKTGGPLLIGVFVDTSFDNILHISKIIPLDGIQLHGTETPELCKALRKEGYLVIKAFGIDEGFDFESTTRYQEVSDYFLFDKRSSKLGGTGETFSWKKLEEYKGSTPFLLSGGISPDMSEFPKNLQFSGIDLNSRFETSAGVKDISLLATFIKQFRNE